MPQNAKDVTAYPCGLLKLWFEDMKIVLVPLDLLPSGIPRKNKYPLS